VKQDCSAIYTKMLTDPYINDIYNVTPATGAKPAGIIETVNTAANFFDFVTKFHPFISLAKWDGNNWYSGGGVAVSLPYHLQVSGEVLAGHQRHGKAEVAAKFILW
jgi:hypothetical protein